MYLYLVVHYERTCITDLLRVYFSINPRNADNRKPRALWRCWVDIDAISIRVGTGLGCCDWEQQLLWDRHDFKLSSHVVKRDWVAMENNLAVHVVTKEQRLHVRCIVHTCQVQRRKLNISTGICSRTLASLRSTSMTYSCVIGCSRYAARPQ